MRFQTQILVRLIAPLIVGFLLIAATAIVLFFARVPAQISSIQSTLAANEMDHFAANAAGAARLCDATFSDFANQITSAATQARDTLGLDGATLDPALTEPNPYPSYYAGTLDGQDPPLPPFNMTNLVSAYFNNNITTLAQFRAMQPDQTSVLDNVFRAAVVNQPKIRGIQIGFPDGGWRIYPLKYNLTAFDARSSNFCNGQNVPDSLKGAAGFIPQCRQFYITAVTANANKPAPAAGISDPVFTMPYPAGVSGQLLVGASVSLYKGGKLYGVLALQILVQALSNKLANTPILYNGYVYIVDPKANVVLYPQSKTSLNIYNADMITSISSVEFNNNTQLFSDFWAKAQSVVDKNTTATYAKPDGTIWTFAAASVNKTGHILVVTAPNSDILSLADSMRNTYTTLLSVSLTATILCTLLCAYIAFRVTNGFAKRILGPIDGMMVRLNSIARNQLNVEFEAQPLVSHELNSVNDNFKNLLTAVRFGNKAYYADDLQVALDNYLAAEALMLKFGNLRGEGVCANNLGNVYRMLDGEFEQAVAKYNRAVEIATVMLEAPNTAFDAQMALKTVLANRLNNLGVLFKENTDDARGKLTPRDAETAATFFARALTLHRQCDNVEGIAQVSGNIGQLLLLQGKVDEAEQMMTDSFNLVRQKGNNPVALQYACLNMGLLCEAQMKFNEAATWYLYVLQRFRVVVKFVQKLVLQRLIALCEETNEKRGVNRPELGRKLREVGAPIFGVDPDTIGGKGQKLSQGGRKNVTFVLDVSGSMSGSFIQTCRKSIKDIIHKHCGPNDAITLIKFNNTHKTLFKNLTKSDAGALATMTRNIETQTDAEGGTAFYATVAFAVAEVAAAPALLGKKWLVCLTDGEDSSWDHSAPLLKIKTLLRNNQNLGIIVITVGSLNTEGEIRAMLQDAGPKLGMLIRSEANSDGIKQAFGKAVRAMQGGDVNVESL
ncbi:hypothetical protein BC830DRAFT_1117607 [Chytriomyces sp. MP71]|nr:hypothetical protein BC830DRAFT_1117607 [Chytriomyces sp. MP71]